jgi:hypothetical protein
MTDVLNLHAYVVTLSFNEGGPLHTHVVVAPNVVNATALATVALMQQTPITAPLLSCLAFELEADHLRHLLRAVEGKLPASGTADVLSLVPNKTENPPQILGDQIHPQPAEETEEMNIHHRLMRFASHPLSLGVDLNDLQPMLDEANKQIQNFPGQVPGLYGMPIPPDPSGAA